MKTYERLDEYMRMHPEEFYGTDESLTQFLKKLNYDDDTIKKLLSNPTSRECVEVNHRTYDAVIREKHRGIFHR